MHALLSMSAYNTYFACIFVHVQIGCRGFGESIMHVGILDSRILLICFVLSVGAFVVMVMRAGDKKSEGDASAQAACEPATQPSAEADDDLPPPPPPETDSTDPKSDLDQVTSDPGLGDREGNEDQSNKKGTTMSEVM